MQRVVNAIIWVAIAVVVTLGIFYVAAVWVVTAPFDRARYHAGRAFRHLAVASVKLNPLWHFEIEGQGPPDPRRPYVAVSNHESYADIFLISHFPWEMKWLSKAELFRIPVFGWYMHLGGHVAVERGDPVRALASLRAAAALVRGGTSLIVFPEGTRSRDGRIQPFKKGPFALAMEAGVPVVPVAIAGSARVTPSGFVSVSPGAIRVAVGEPVHPGAFADRLAFLNAVRQRVIELHLRIGGLGGHDGDPAAPRGNPHAPV